MRPISPTTRRPPAAGRAVTILAFAALAAAACLPAPRAACASYMVPEGPWRPKEAALIRQGSLFHLFYTRGMPFAPFDSTWNDLGHAVSANLYDWVDWEAVLPRRPGEWDNHQVWAPCVVQVDTLYYMFYTGITDSPPDWVHHQRIGLATSKNLSDWTRLPAPVFECADVPWSFCVPSMDGGGDFRDPYVMPDPDLPGHWLMFYTARASNAPGRLLIGRARSDGDFTRWTDAGPMWNTTQIHTLSDVTETPDVLVHNGLWYLFYTTWNAHPIWFQTASNPMADSSGWSPQVALHDEVPQNNTDPSFGPEHYFVDGHDLYYLVNSAVDGIEFLEFVWGVPPHFGLVDPWLVDEQSLGAPHRDEARFALRAITSEDGVRFVADAPRTMRATLRLVDVTGRRLRTLFDGTLGPGPTPIAWDGRAEAGFAAPSGVYFAVLESALGRRVARFARLR